MKKLVIGIQGGIGSFNEEAITYYVNRNQITDSEIKYLHTSENVLRALNSHEIEIGQFAIHNSAGGIVDESVVAMGKYSFSIVDKFAIKISHALLIHRESKLSEIDTIMTHPQVLAQCKNNLLQKYPHLKLVSGEGELLDHALVAKSISEGKIPPNIATMGSKVLASVYDLKIVEENLQDLSENFTTFLIVNRLVR